MTPLSLNQMKSSGSVASSSSRSTHSSQELFSNFARKVSTLSAHRVTFVVALATVAIWALCGPATHYSEIWQLWINTSTTILTFLMVFLLQNAQMRDTRALHIKLDELLRAISGARNELIDIEDLSQAELERYATEFKRMHVRYAEAIARKREKPAGDTRPAPPGDSPGDRAAGGNRAASDRSL